ncbi:tetratricopeptide (TPR) repeat protein [Paenibacillus endophyticus]|uniref:Tetratricopeptide (TPR) repeat protein n=1 Tax=Paenibacillus endophyticus TaxID=1294268 RepID=A0A7W5C7N5_9BACL|nr:glycosyltransferase family 2 protein [Paenibacillus endophyticus]MBB3152641.1 tetratricopeptide (TPR) repeat protein [Paenibacillus endophyticus]
MKKGENQEGSLKLSGLEGNQLPVSLCMIVRNEESFLPACLASAINYVSEIIVVDTGSCDNTIEIAERFGATVVCIEWSDDFAAARNEGLKLAAQPWVLVLDADERLDESPLQIWEDLLANQAFAGYYVRLCSWIGAAITSERQLEPAKSYISDAVCRLFRNDPRIRFTGALHEEVATSVSELGAQRLGYAPLTVWHEGYRPEVVEAKGKRERNGRILLQAIGRNPEDAMLQYAMGTECFTYGNWSGAAAWLGPLAQSLKPEQGYASDLLLKLSHALRLLGRPDEAETWARNGIERLGFADFPDLYEALALALLEQDKNAAALRVLQQALELGLTPAHYSTAPGAGSYRTLFTSGLANERIYEWENAWNNYMRSVSLQPAYMPAWERMVLLGTVDGRYRQRFLGAAAEWAIAEESGKQSFQQIRSALLERVADAGFMQTDDGYKDERSDLVINGLVLAAFNEEDDMHILFWRGLFSVQQGRLEEGRLLWEQLPENDERRAVYLKALELRGVEAPGVWAPATEQALLRVGAWRAWSAFRAASDSAAALPPLQWCAVIRAPQACRAALRSTLASGSSAPARLAAGVLAAAAADWRAAAGSFGAAATDAAAAPWVARAAAAGLAAAFAARARAALPAPACAALPVLQIEAELKLRAVSALFF